MTSTTTKPNSLQPEAETSAHLFDNWFDPIEAGLRDRVREFIHAMIEGELDTALKTSCRPAVAADALRCPGGISHKHHNPTAHRGRTARAAEGQPALPLS